MNMEGKKSVVIEEIFDSMIVFSEAEWVDSDGVATREVDFPSRLARVVASTAVAVAVCRASLGRLRGPDERCP